MCTLGVHVNPMLATPPEHSEVSYRGVHPSLNAQDAAGVRGTEPIHVTPGSATQSRPAA
jgi:hypothetical protein